MQAGVHALLQGLTIENGQGYSGHGYSGGGIYNAGGTVTVSDSTLAYNSASSGGGIYNAGGTLTVSDSTFANNVGYYYGGGITNTGGTVTVSDSTLAYNSAYAFSGGGIYNYQGTVTVSDSTIANNSAVSGGGIYNQGGTLTLLSSIVAANYAYSVGPDVYGSVSGSDNLIGDGSGMSGISNNDANGNLVGVTGSNPNVINPDLLPLGNYGGVTQTMPPAANSPALNAGGLLTTLTSTIGGAGTTFTVANAAAISSTPGIFDLQVDGEQILVSYTSGNSFTVVQRGFNGTTQANPSSGDAVFLALDQSGRARVIGGQTDIGAAETLLVSTTSDSVSHTGFSLRDALSQANTDASNGISDLIVFASSLDGQTITLSQGELNLSGAGTGTITIDGAGQMTISGANASTVFAVQAGVQALLEGLTIENGQGNFGTFSASGGGIYNNGGTVTVSDSTLAHNSATYGGGGIYNYRGTLTVSDSTLADNSASYDGGGIYNYRGTLTVSDSTLDHNSAGYGGGGIYNHGGTLTVSDSTLDHNSAGEGGGIFIYGGTLTVSDSTLDHNSATYSGGGIYTYSGTVTVSDSTLADNSAYSGGGIYNAGGTLTLLSTIVAANTASSGPDVIGSVSGSYNLIGDGSGMSGISNGSNGNQVGSSASVLNPDLLPLGNYGGPTQTMPPAANSPALNTGGPLTTLTSAIGAAGTTFTVANAAAISSTPGIFDLEVDGEQIQVSYASGNTFTVLQRGFNGTTQASPSSGDAVFLALDQSGRARVVNGQTDIGAAETLQVSTTSDSAAHTGVSLRDALALANSDASNGISDLIVFASSLDGQTITLSQAELNLSGAGTGTITIDGAGQMTISGANASTVFAVQSGVQALLEGLTIENGKGSNGSFSDSGGGIYNNGGTLTVSDSTLDHNSASAFGGGILNASGTVTVSDSTLVDNSAFTGGGIYNAGGTLTVSDSTLAYNSASFYGGGILNASGTVTVSDSTLADNSAAEEGGGIYTYSGTVTVSDSTLADNSADFGGGITNYAGRLTVSDSTLADNSAYFKGGGIFNYFGTLTLLSSIVAANTAGAGPDVYGSVSGNYNLIGNGSGMTGISNNDANGNLVGVTGSNPNVINPELLPLGNYGGVTQTMPPAANSPALNTGGPLTTLTSTIGAAGTTFTVANASAISSTPGVFDLQVDGEQILVNYTSGNSFTVVQRGYNGTTQASPSSGDAVFLALDQSGRARVIGGQTDIGPPRLCW